MLDIKENELMSSHTSFRIGGPARYFVVVKNMAEIDEAINFAKKNKIGFKVIGGGSNLLVADSGYDGLIIKYFGGEIKTPPDLLFRKGEETELEIDGGVPLVKAMHEALKNNLSGLEWAIGIPGTIGGAVCNNAGAFGGDISQIVVSVKIFRDGKIIELENDDCGFGYRESTFRNGAVSGIILSVRLKMKKIMIEELAVIKEKMEKNLADRLSKSAEGGSAGSTFRNFVLSEVEINKFKEKFPQLPDQFVAYKKIPAAWLIEECGLKGKKIGDAMVSEKHAGKITNVGHATAEHVVMLISVVKQKVRSNFSLQLMEEIEYVGF